jgi:hypothetical protein
MEEYIYPYRVLRERGEQETPLFSDWEGSLGPNNEEQFQKIGERGYGMCVSLQVLRVFGVFVQGRLTPSPSPDESTHLERGASTVEPELFLRNQGVNEQFLVVLGQKWIKQNGFEVPLARKQTREGRLAKFSPLGMRCKLRKY